MKTIELEITKKLHGAQIKSILYNQLKFSARLITKVKQSNGIRLNGVCATVRNCVQSGDVLNITIPEERSENIAASDIKLDIVYEDEDILLVNKPAGMPTHPSAGHYNDTLANAVMFYFRDRDFVFRAVTRLDSDTSGLVLIAKNRLAANELCRRIKEKNIRKTYLAICCGELPTETGFVEAPIARAGAIKRVVSETGQYARTEYRVLKYENGYSLVELVPITGRTHQIRVHMAHMGNPLYGDFLYGREIEGERTRLHCCGLSFLHPQSGEKCEFFLPPPEDFFII